MKIRKSLLYILLALMLFSSSAPSETTLSPVIDDLIMEHDYDNAYILARYQFANSTAQSSPCEYLKEVRQLFHVSEPTDDYVEQSENLINLMESSGCDKIEIYRMKLALATNHTRSGQKDKALSIYRELTTTLEKRKGDQYVRIYASSLINIGILTFPISTITAPSTASAADIDQSRMSKAHITVGLELLRQTGGENDRAANYWTDKLSFLFEEAAPAPQSTPCP